MSAWLLLIWMAPYNGHVTGIIHEQAFYSSRECAVHLRSIQTLLRKRGEDIRYYGFRCIKAEMPPMSPPPNNQEQHDG